MKEMVALHESLILYFSISALNGDSVIELYCSSIVVAVHSCIGATPENRSGGIHMGVSKNRGTPKVDGLEGKTLLELMIWGYPIFGNTHIWWCFVGQNTQKKH